MSEFGNVPQDAELSLNIPDYIRNGAEVFEFEGKKYGFSPRGKDLYVDGPTGDEKFDSCYIVRHDGIVDGDHGAVPGAETPSWVSEATKLASEKGLWPVFPAHDSEEEIEEV